MVEFSLSNVSQFPIPKLDAISDGDQVACLQQAQRRESLFSEPNRTTFDWMARAAEYHYEAGLCRMADQYSSQLGIAALEAGDDRFLAKAYLWQILSAMITGREPKLTKRFHQLRNLERHSSDPCVRAVRLFVQSSALYYGYTWDPSWSHNDWCEVFVSYKEASRIFLDLSEVDMAILCHIEYANAKIHFGRYISALEWVESALRLAQKHSAWKWTGRMLEAAGSAATDQGYRDGVEDMLHKAVAWCSYVGDEFGRISSITALGRLTTYEMPPLKPALAEIPLGYLNQAFTQAVLVDMPWLQKKAETAREFTLTKSGLNAPVDSTSRRLPDIAYLDRTDINIVKQVNSRLEDGIGDSPDPFMTFNALRNDEFVCRDFINEYRNRAASQLLGKGPVAIGLYSEYRQSPYLVGLSDHLRNAADRRLKYQDVVEVANGEETQWFQRQITPSGDGAILKLRNVTAERQVQQALTKAAESARISENVMSEFLANMSHEIRTPISGVLGLARMLDETNLNPEQRGYLKDIIGSGDTLLALIGDILDMSKLDAGFIEIKPEPTLLHDLVNSLVRLYRGQAAQKKVKVETFIDSRVPKAVQVDGLRLRQVLSNLIGNAVKFTPQGAVKIAVRLEGNDTLFEVADTGMGIPASDLESVFERFQQSSNSTRLTGGTGLGLTISKRLVNLMGGSILVDSIEGQGSCFTVRLQLPSSEEPLTRTTEDLPKHFNGARILLVEDNEVNKVVSQHFLRKLGCNVLWASDGPAALAAFDREPFHLVFMDVRLPGMDGLEVTREMRRRQSKSGARTPIVALTAGALSGERDNCFQAGMDDYISKPFADEALRTVLAKWVGPINKK